MSAFFVLARVGAVPADLLIDSFAVTQSAPGVVDTRNTAAGAGILGGERDIVSYLTLSVNGTVPGQFRVSYPSSGISGLAGLSVAYDGVDNDPSSGSFSGLGSVDLTQGGVNDRFRFELTSVATLSATLQVRVLSPNHGSRLTLNLPSTPGAFDFPFSSFTQDPVMSLPVDFHNAGYIELNFVMNNGESATIDSVIATVPEPSALSLGLLSLPVASVAFSRGRKLNPVQPSRRPVP